MKKLRLIKPWRLRALRQRVDNTDNNTPEDRMGIHCNAPGGKVVKNLASRNILDPSSLYFIAKVCFENHNRAPHSDVIFVCLNRNIR